MLPFPKSRIATTGGVYITVTFEVYNGQLLRELSRLSKLIVHDILEINSIDKGFFVRFYDPDRLRHPRRVLRQVG